MMKYKSINKIMFLVIIALLPGICVQFYYFGYGNSIQIILSIISALITEIIFLKVRNLPIIKSIKDNSAVLTAILIGISLPPLSPWWMIVLGNIFAIFIGKHLYGGLGQNIFNPAMVGYIMLFISFPTQINNWFINSYIYDNQLNMKKSFNIIFNKEKNNLKELNKNFDSISQATPLSLIKNKLQFSSFFNDNKISKYFWININISFILGGIFLIFINIIKWHMPFFFILSIIICSIIEFLIYKHNNLIFYFQKNLFFGSTMLGAFFIITDPVTSAVNTKGRIILSIFNGLLLWIIRTFSNYSDGVGFAILIGNSISPLIDYFTIPIIKNKKLFNK